MKLISRSSLAATSMCIGLLSASNAAQAAYTFYLDELNITRNGAALFNDSFTDGIAPPSAPNFANGSAGSYGVVGTMSESGGKLVLDSTGAVINPSGFANNTQVAVLNSNTSTLLADANKGLKSDYIFSVMGLFDLTLPGVVGEAYGIRLSDKAATNGTDTFNLGLRTFSDGVYVELRQVDFDTVTSTVLQRIALDTSAHDQILLSLERLSTSSNALTASYKYVDGGVAGAATTFAAAPTIFNSVNFTRAGIYANTPVPVPAAVWLLGSGLMGLVAVARKRKVA